MQKQIYGLFLILMLAAGCEGDMRDQPRYEPLEKSDFFSDGMASRPQVAGTIARGTLKEDEHLHSGIVNGQLAETFPFPVTREVLDQGRERFSIYCSVCHDQTGSGNGMVVKRGFTQAASFHQDRLRKVPAGYFIQVMNNGFGQMPSFAKELSAEERWAVAAYIRVLQLSQNVNYLDLNENDKKLWQEQEHKEPDHS